MEFWDMSLGKVFHYQDLHSNKQINQLLCYLLNCSQALVLVFASVLCDIAGVSGHTVDIPQQQSHILILILKWS